MNIDLILAFGLVPGRLMLGFLLFFFSPPPSFFSATKCKSTVTVCTCSYRPNRKIPVFRVTRPYLNLLVKPRIFSGFLEKNIIRSILKGEMPFKMDKINICFQKKIINKYVCLPNLNFSALLPKTHLFFIWPKHTQYSIVFIRPKLKKNVCLRYPSFPEIYPPPPPPPQKF